MRKNFTQKFLTIFAFLTVLAFGNETFAQTFPEGDQTPPQCTNEFAGRIAFDNCSTEKQACPGTGIGPIRGDGFCGSISTGTVTGNGTQLAATGGTVGTSPGTGNGGGTLVTYQWFYRTSPTSNFITVPVSFRTGVAVNGNAANADSTGTGQNYSPAISLTSAAGSLDFVRVRYSGTENLPRTCASISNIVTAYDDRTRPVIFFNGGQAAADTVQASPDASCTATVPLLAGFNFGSTGSPRNPDGGINAFDNVCTTTPATTKFTIRYFRNVTFGSTPPNSSAQPNSPFSVSGPSFNGTEVTSPVTLNVGTTTRITVMVADSSGNYDTVGYNITITDTTRPVYTGFRALTRFTEPLVTSCAANIEGSELAPRFTDCNTPIAVTYRILDSATLAPSAGVSGANSGTFNQTTSGSNSNFGNRTFQRGTYFIVYEGRDPSLNVSGVGPSGPNAARTEYDTLKLRVVDNTRPTIVAPTSESFTIDAGACRRTFAAGNTQFPQNSGNPMTPFGAGTDCVDQTPNNMTLCLNPRTADGCGVTQEFVYGPDNLNFPYGTSNSVAANGPIYDNTYFRVGQNRLSYVAIDASGNRSDSVFQTITIIDNVRPIVFCPANETQSTSNLQQSGSTCTYTVPGLVGSANDQNGCPVRLVRFFYFQNGVQYSSGQVVPTRVGNTNNYTFTVNNPFAIGMTTVKTVAYDTTGQAVGGTAFNTTGDRNASDTCSFVVTVNDNTAPTVTCRPFTMTLNSAGTGNLTVANVVASSFDCNPRANNAGFTLSRTAFTCADVTNASNGPVPVTVTFTDSAGNSTSCTAMVTVRSSITVSSAITSSFCSNSGSFTVTPSGGTGPNYSYDVTGQTPAGPDPANPAAGTSGTFSNLAAGTYNLRVTDPSTGCTLDTTVVVGNGAKATTDVAITAGLGSGSSTTLSSTNTNTRLDVRVSEIGGFSAPNVSFFVLKAELPSGVALTMLPNAEWTFSESASEYTFTRVGGTLNCGSSSTVGVNVSRTGTPQSGPFGITFSLNAITGESSQFTYNNGFTSRLTVRNP